MPAEAQRTAEARYRVIAARNMVMAVLDGRYEESDHPAVLAGTVTLLDRATEWLGDEA